MTKWKIIYEGMSDPTFRHGGVSRTYRIVECPECGYQFSQKISSGCFMHREDPFKCKQCQYPYRESLERIEKLKNEVKKN